MTPPQKEYIITEEQLTDMVENVTVGYSPYRAEVAKEVRSRPTPSEMGRYAEMKNRPEYTPDAAMFNACQKCKAAIRNATLDEIKKYCLVRSSCCGAVKQLCYDAVISKIQSLRTPTTQEQP